MMEWHKMLVITCIGLLFPSIIADDAYRLPRNINDISYDIHIMVPEDFAASSEFRGIVAINFTVIQNTRTIKLHSDVKYLQSVTLNNASINFEVNSTTNILTINSTVELQAGQYYVLLIEYVGTLRNDMHGFYRSKYIDPNGTTKYILATHFEPNFAREAFPCFDEPKFRATFSLKMSYPPWMTTVISNTKPHPQFNSSTDGSLKKILFETTPDMPTYLLAFVVSEFTCETDPDPSNVKFSICSRPELVHTRAFANDISKKIMESYETRFNQTYGSLGINKMEQVAIPDFAAGAMENWGLVTYREAALLVDPTSASNANKQRTMEIITHEFAHMWFGNLVALDWWSDTFMNEGFARYYQYHMATEIIEFQDWEMSKQFVVESHQFIFEEDSMGTEVALSSSVSTPDEINHKFNGISYNKGASIIRMISHVLGDESFNEAIQTYLHFYKYQNTKPEHLWYIFESHAKLPNSVTFASFIDPWIMLPGYPVLNVDAKGDHIILSQKQFLLNGNDTSSKWYIPISYTKSSNIEKFSDTRPSIILKQTDESIMVDNLLEDQKWIIFNNQQAGFYRVNYSERLWNNLLNNGLNEHNLNQIHVINRAQIVDDVLNLARAGGLSYVLALDVVSYLSNEIEYYPWKAAFRAFSFILDRTGGSALGEKLEEYILKLSGKLQTEIAFHLEDPREHLFSLSQELGLNWLCRLGNRECIQQADARFASYKINKQISSNLKSVILCSVVRNNEDNWNYLWQEYENATSSTQQVTILKALGCTKNKTILNLYLRKVLEPNSKIRLQDANYVLLAILDKNVDGVNVALDFFINNFSTLKEHFAGTSNLKDWMKQIVQKLNSQEQLDKVNSLITDVEMTDNADFLTATKKYLLAAKQNLIWTKLHKKELESYFGMTHDEISDSSPNLHSQSILALTAILTVISW